ncbi:hypothetical protein [Microcystis phage Mae-JY09]
MDMHDDDPPDVERSVRRIADAMEREAQALAGAYPIIAEHFRSEADRLRRLTG